MLTEPTNGRTVDSPRVTCSTEGCDVELMPNPKHVDNLLAAGWTCTRCKREGR